MRNSESAIDYRSSGGIVVDPTGHLVLLLIRPSRDEVRLPKGHVEPGESLAETAVRETREESGYADLEIIADLGEQLVTFLLEGRQVRRIEHYFLMQAQSLAQCEQPQSDLQQFFTTWVPWSEVEEHLTFAAEQEWIRRAQRAWKSGDGRENRN